MTVFDFVGVLDREQPIVIVGNFAAGLYRTVAGELVSSNLLSRQVLRAYAHDYQNEIVIETVDK